MSPLLPKAILRTIWQAVGIAALVLLAKVTMLAGHDKWALAVIIALTVGALFGAVVMINLAFLESERDR